MSEPIYNGGPAMPFVIGDTTSESWSGMSLRDWFAGHALCGLLLRHGDERPCAELAKDAMEFADAMIAARKEKP